MPKLKTNRGAAKRFKRTANHFKYRRGYRNHILTKRATKQKRRLRATGKVSTCHIKAVRRLLKEE